MSTFCFSLCDESKMRLLQPSSAPLKLVPAVEDIGLVVVDSSGDDHSTGCTIETGNNSKHEDEENNCADSNTCNSSTAPTTE
ncbi:hypothetical protein pdam_00015107 [Pocillopora damicornis]|uniref:Uncharacterized protein n=1 Tax=Pocillopora damicornis TaxID=46731 RepID=A0A3M6UMY7_POCDA|nr:hypothetical protein pdam_00015107 [Pocillopora damicornis]